MTKTEYRKCEKLMERSIKKAKLAHKEYIEAERYMLFYNYNTILSQAEQGKADRHNGEAMGIYQALRVFGFEHSRMDELLELL